MGSSVNAPRRVDIKGQPHQLSYITPEEANVLKALGGAGKPGPMGIPSFYDEGDDYGGVGGDSFADASGGQTTDVSMGDMYGGSSSSSSDDSPTSTTQSKEDYFAENQITETNPYGKRGFFSRMFGIDPSKIDYSDQMSRATRIGIMNNMFSKYANPFNDPSVAGYNPAFASGDIESGILRSGVSVGQTVVDPNTGLETTVESFRAPQSLSDLVASGIASFAIPGAGFLTNEASKVKGLAGQAPTIDGQTATPLGQGLGLIDALTGGIKSGVQSQSGRLLDAVSAKASEILNQGSSVQQGEQQLQQPMMESRQDIINRVTPSQPEITNQGVMDALGIPREYQNNAPRVSGLAAVPTQQTADASGLSFGESLGALQNSPLGQAVQRGIRGESVIPDMNIGGGKLGVSVDPMGSDKGFEFNFSAPVSDFGLGGLLSQNQPQAPADQAFDVAQANNTRGGFFSGNYRGNRTQSQGGGMFGVPGTKARLYQPSQKGNPTGSGNAGMFDKMAQMFKTGIFG